MEQLSGEIFIREVGDYTVRVEVPTDPYSVSFKVREVTGIEADGTRHYEDDEPFMTGFIKWDGCSQFYFPDGQMPNIHFDTVEDFQDFGKLLLEMRAMAAETMPEHWAGDD